MPQMRQRIGFLYLKTGGGHYSGARALINHLKEKYPEEADFFLKNGFSEKNVLSRMFFEQGYAATSNYFEPAYVAFYQLTKSFRIVSFVEKLIRAFFIKNLVQFLKTKQITKVVCLHEILVPLIREAINRVDPAIDLVTVVLDPFTAHPMWFYEKDTDLVVFSQKLQREAVETYGFQPERVRRFPLMLSTQFDTPYSKAEQVAAKKKHQVPLDKKVLLIVGGGEGLKKTRAIITAAIKHKSQCHLLVVCGKNKLLKQQLEKLIKREQLHNIQLFGFVPFMPDLINISDCVITKAGPATVLETLSVGKPLILASYVRGQELGNMLYVVQNGLGWYIPDADEIIRKADEILYDDAVLGGIEKRIQDMHIQNGLYAIADFVYEFGMKNK